jgi:GAF domain-containing protein
VASAGEVSTEIVADASGDPVLGRHLDDLLTRTCHLARGLTGAEQAAFKIDLRGDGSTVRKLFSLGEEYAGFRGYRVDPRGLGLHGIHLEPGEVVRLTQEEVERHPAWLAFGNQAGHHPPMRGWLATPVCSEGPGRRSFGLLQLTDKSGGRDFTAADADAVRELAALVGSALDALAAAVVADPPARG